MEIPAELRLAIREEVSNALHESQEQLRVFEARLDRHAQAIEQALNTAREATTLKSDIDEIKGDMKKLLEAEARRQGAESALDKARGHDQWSWKKAGLVIAMVGGALGIISAVVQFLRR